MNYVKDFQSKNNLVVDGIVGPKTLLKMKDVFNIPSIEATAHFVGQVDHETAGFKYDIENLNYSVKGLLRVFKRYFPTEDIAKKYARNPEKIANRVYANRMGNGDEQSGDGWKMRGRGALQLTGRDNITEYSRYVKNKNIITNPDLVLPDHYWKVAVFFFQRNNLWKLTNKVDYNSVRKLTRRINGGYNGLQHRYDRTIHYYKLLKKK